MRHLWIVLGALAAAPAQKWSWNGCAPGARARYVGKSCTKKHAPDGLYHEQTGLPQQSVG
jgi:hypothetical protein